MLSMLRSVLLVLAESTHQELARQVRYLKVENEILRSKLPKRLPIEPAERRRLVRFAAPVGRALVHLASIVSPQTLWRWIREDRRTRRRGKQWVRGQGRRRTSLAVRRLIVKLGRETGWGYTRIMGELKKLGVKPPSRNTVKNILKTHGFEPESPRGAGTWDDFLKRHAHSLWQCDFVSRRILSWRGLREAYVLVFMHVVTRRVIVTPLSYHPDDAWVVRQTEQFVREAREQGLRIRHVFHDGDGKFRRPYRTLWKRQRIRNRKAPFRAPNTQAFIERFIQTLQIECWDHFWICGLQHLAFLTREFLAYYHTERPHQGLDNELIATASRRRRKLDDEAPPLGEIACRTRLGGLWKHYERRAA